MARSPAAELVDLFAADIVRLEESNAELATDLHVTREMLQIALDIAHQAIARLHAASDTRTVA